jgi:hypothetical protein
MPSKILPQLGIEKHMFGARRAAGMGAGDGFPA